MIRNTVTCDNCKLVCACKENENRPEEWVRYFLEDGSSVLQEVDICEQCRDLVSPHIQLSDLKNEV